MQIWEAMGPYSSLCVCDLWLAQCFDLETRCRDMRRGRGCVFPVCHLTRALGFLLERQREKTPAQVSARIKVLAVKWKVRWEKSYLQHTKGSSSCHRLILESLSCICMWITLRRGNISGLNQHRELLFHMREVGGKKNREADFTPLAGKIRIYVCIYITSFSVN